MNKQVDPKFIKASYLIFASLVLNLIIYLLQNFGSYSFDSLLDISFLSLFLLLLFFLTRRGYNWVKWVLLIVLINKVWDLYGLILIISYAGLDLFSLVMYLLSTIPLIIATILLFTSPAVE